jgi:tape measure domain-containing protein
MATLKTVIEIAANTAAAEKGLGNVSAQVDRLVGSIKRVGQYAVGLFGAAEALQAARDLGKLSDQYRNLEGRVKLAAGSQNQFTEAQRALFAIAQNNAQALAGVSQLYSRIARGAVEMGVSQQQVLSIIDSVAKSFRVSGATAQEAEAATLQFSQALAAGVLRGEEFNSVIEQAPRLAQAIADGLDVPIGKLRALAEAGELTTQKVVEALAKAKAGIDKDAAGLPDTIGQAMVRWDNAALKFVGTSPAITRAAEAIADAINGAAENIDKIAAAAEVAGTAVAALLAGRIAGAVATAIAGMGAVSLSLSGIIALLGGPAGIVAALAVAAGAWKLFGSEAESNLDKVARKALEVKSKAGGKEVSPEALAFQQQTALDEAALAKQRAAVDDLARQYAAYEAAGKGAGQARKGRELFDTLTQEKNVLGEMVRLFNLRQAAADADRTAKKERELAKSFAETKAALKDATEQAETYYQRRLAAINAIEQTGITRITQAPPKQPVPGESSTLGGIAQPNNKARTELEQAQAVFRLQQQAEQARLTAMRDYANQRLALVDQVYGKEIAKYKDGEDKKTQLERESLQARRAIYAGLEAAYAATIDKLIAQERRLRDEAVAAARARVDIERETRQAVAGMAQAQATPAEAARAQYLELQKLMAEQQSALAAGNLDLSRQAGNQAKGIAEALGQQIAAALRDVKQKIADLAKEKTAAEAGKTTDQRQKEFIGQNDARNLIDNADPVRQFIAGASGPEQPKPQPGLGTQDDLQKLIRLRQEIGQLLAEAETKAGQAAITQAEQTAQEIQTALQGAQSVGAEIDKIDQKLAQGFNLKVQADPAALQALQTQLQELLKPETKIINVKVVKDGNAITATPDGASPDTGLTVPGFRRGGWIKGYGGGDRIPALLEEGEFVLRKEAVRKFGLDRLYALNNLAIPRFSIGGYVAQAVPAFDASLARAEGGQPVHIHLPGVPGSFALNGDPQVVRALQREVAKAALKHGRIVR